MWSSYHDIKYSYCSKGPCIFIIKIFICDWVNMIPGPENAQIPQGAASVQKGEVIQALAKGLLIMMTFIGKQQWW